MRTRWRWLGVGMSLATLACGRSDAGANAAARTPTLPATSDCAHAACGEGYFVDALVQDGCAAAPSCRVELKLVATGEFHVNDEYPYRFKADALPGFEFLGTDSNGKNVFSKPAGDWTKADAKSGVLAVKLLPATAGAETRAAATLSGVFKLSVCSSQTCLIDQPQVRAVLAAR